MTPANEPVILINDMKTSKVNKSAGGDRRQRAFRIASGFALAAWIGTTLAALMVAVFGVIGLAGWGDYPQKVEASVPGLSLNVGFQPSWTVTQDGDVCQRVDLNDPSTDCFNLVLHRGEPQNDGSTLLQGDVRPVSAHLSGPLLLDAEPGWNPLMASLYGMQVLGMLVLAFLLAQLWRILRAASHRDEFTDAMVRRLRIMGATLVGWEFVEPFLWLFFSPKANDYSYTVIGPWPHLSLGSMEPGGPNWTVVAFGLLIVLLAELFRHGADLVEEQKLTI